MELYRLGLPDEESIIVKDKFVIDTIIPLCIKKITEKDYSILFFAEQNSTETSLYLQAVVAMTDETDEGFLNTHPLNVTVIQQNPERLKFYNEKIDNMHGNTFNTDFDMEEFAENKRYFHANASKPMYVKGSEKPMASFVDLLITRDNFVRLSLFFTKFLCHDPHAESMFITHKLRNVEFETITHVKLDGSSHDKINKIVFNHYTMGHGPSMYRMTFISPEKPHGKLRNPMAAEHYRVFYPNDFIIQDIIFDHHQDRIFIVFELRSDITNTYKCTKILILDKEVYDHTNFVDIYKIYE